MKKEFFTAMTCTAMVLLLASCASSNTKSSTRSEPKAITVNNEDDYEDTIVEGSDDEYIDSEVDTNNNNIDKQKKSGGRFSSLFTFGNKGQFANIDETTVFTRTLSGSIAAKKASVMIDLEKSTAGFGSNYLTQYYIVQLGKADRTKLAQAYKSYLKDFENKKLVRKSSKTYKAYGTIQVHLDWGTLNTSTPNNADGTAYLGYEFVKNSPYFTISNFPLENNYRKVIGDTAQEESLALKYYFTKAQLQELINMLDEDVIAEYCGEYFSDTHMKDIETDAY